MKKINWILCVAALLSLSCGGGEEANENDTSSMGELTSGDEQAGGAPEGTAADLEQPPGSVQPEGITPGTPTATNAGASAETEAATGTEWGAAEAESGEPLPERRAMAADARDAYRQGMQSADAGNLEGAKAQFERALEADPRSFKVLYALGVVADRMGQENRALDYYRQALRIQPDYERAIDGTVAIYLRRGSTSEALSFIEPLARRWQRNLAVQATYAEVLVHADRVEDAVNAARAALRRDERYVPAMVALAKANLKRGRTELAEDVLSQAKQIDETNAEIHFLLGRMLAEQGRLGEAMTSYQRAVQLRPDYADARMALGIQQLRGGNYGEALSNFESVSRLAPTQLAVHLNLGEAYRATKQWQKAKASYDRAAEMDPNLAEVHFNLGLLYLSAGAEFPGPDLLTALQRAQSEFTAYRNQMGPRLARDDQSQSYLEDITRRIEREQKRLERERQRAEREKARQAREAANPPATPPETPAPADATQPATPPQ